MKIAEKAGIARIISFILIATVLVCTIGLVVSGWQTEAPSKQPDSGDSAGDSANADENKDGKTNQDDKTDGDNTKVNETVFVNYLTGTAISDELFRTCPVAFVCDPRDPVYALSLSDLTIEFPTETGATRLLVYHRDLSALGKIGSLTKTRSYIHELVMRFGGISVFRGIDGYGKDAFAAQHALDIDATTGYSYTENSVYMYTNGDLIRAALMNNGFNSALTETPVMPYDFTETPKVQGTAGTIILPYSGQSETELYYSADRGAYIYSKSGVVKTDMLNGRTVTYKNVLVLFADSVTYETEKSTETVINTCTHGTGYYAVDGKMCEITWETDEHGDMIFIDADGNKLGISAGNIYISYFKSSMKDQVKIQ